MRILEKEGLKFSGVVYTTFRKMWPLNVNHLSDTLFFCCFYSAGIGRTGVLITMETAMCLIECNQPVYPLDIVRTMRDQRAMMIQTPVSVILVFLCCRIISYYLVVSLNIF